MKVRTMKNRQSRASELLRIAAKQGWYAGHAGEEGSAPIKMVMVGGLTQPSNSSLAQKEQAAYWRGYAEGEQAASLGLPGNQNPYGLYRGD